MKKVPFATLTALLMFVASLMLVSLAACKPSIKSFESFNDPQEFFNEIANLLEAYGNDKNCGNVQEAVDRFIDENGNVWADAVIKKINDAKAAGEQPSLGEFEEYARKWGVSPDENVKERIDKYSRCFLINGVLERKKLRSISESKIYPVVTEFLKEVK